MFVSVALAVRGAKQAVVRVVGISDGFAARDYELRPVPARVVSVALVVGVRAGTVLVREPAEGIIIVLTRACVQKMNTIFHFHLTL